MGPNTITEIRKLNPETSVEVLIPDFKGVWEPLERVIIANPEILAHNMETVPRLYRRVRPQAKYDRSLWVLQKSKEAGMVTKSGNYGRNWRNQRRSIGNDERFGSCGS